MKSSVVLATVLGLLSVRAALSQRVLPLVPIDQESSTGSTGTTKHGATSSTTTAAEVSTASDAGSKVTEAVGVSTESSAATNATTDSVGQNSTSDTTSSTTSGSGSSSSSTTTTSESTTVSTTVNFSNDTTGVTDKSDQLLNETSSTASVSTSSNGTEVTEVSKTTTASSTTSGAAASSSSSSAKVKSSATSAPISTEFKPIKTQPLKGQYVNTTGVEKTCKSNIDCYGLREPDEWCPLSFSEKYLDKGCFCDHNRDVCTIVRVTEKGQEYTHCVEKSQSSCLFIGKSDSFKKRQRQA